MHCMLTLAIVYSFLVQPHWLSAWLMIMYVCKAMHQLSMGLTQAWEYAIQYCSHAKSRWKRSMRPSGRKRARAGEAWQSAQNARQGRIWPKVMQVTMTIRRVTCWYIRKTLQKDKNKLASNKWLSQQIKQCEPEPSQLDLNVNSPRAMPNTWMMQRHKHRTRRKPTNLLD